MKNKYRQIEEIPEKTFLKNWYSKRKIQNKYFQGALELDKPNIIKRLNDFKNYEYVDNLSSENPNLNNITGQFNSDLNKTFIKKGISNPSEVKLHELNHNATYNKAGDYITTSHQRIVDNEIKSKNDRSNIYKDDYYQDPREIHSRIMVLRKDAGFKPDVPVTQKDLDIYLKKKEVLDNKGKVKHYNLPENVNDIFQNAKSQESVLNMLNYMAVNDSNKLDNKMQTGGEKNSLWKNIRKNRGSGKKPTAQMLKQEKKIKSNYQTGGDNDLMEMFNQFVLIAEDDDFQSGEDVYNEYIKLDGNQQQQFLSTVKGQYNAQSFDSDDYNMNNNQEVQDVALMQDGGNSKRKYITSDLKDFKKRNKAYNDSLSLYKKFPYKKNDFGYSDEGYKYLSDENKNLVNNSHIKPIMYKSISKGEDLPVYKKPTQKIIYKKPIESIARQQEIIQEVQNTTSPTIQSNTTSLPEYNRGNIRSKNTVDYKATNDGKQWTPEEYSNYIDEQKIKTANYNKSLREMQLGGIIKAQTGIDPRLTKIQQLRKGKFKPSNYQEITNLENDIKNNPKYTQEKQVDNSKYQNTKGILNNDYFLTGDSTKIPFDKSNGIPIAKSNIIPNNNRKPINLSKARANVKTTKANNNSYAPYSVDNYYANQYDKNRFNKEFTPQELDRQFQESLVSQKELALIEPDFKKYPDFVAPNNVGKTDSGYIKAKPITMDFDNPAEAQAIAYKKFKNSQSLSPYKQSVNLKAPGLYQENEAMYLANSREGRNSTLQNINPNSTIGQSLLSNIYSQGLNQENDAIGQVAKNNSQNTTNYLNQRSNVNNQQQQMNNQYNDKYYNDVAQIEAVKNQNDINYMDEISQMNAKRLQAKNRFLSTSIETGLGDALDINDNSVTFDVNKIGARFNGGTDSKKAVDNGNKLNLKMIDGVPHHVYMDADGKPQAYPVNVNKRQLGGMRKFNMKLK